MDKADSILKNWLHSDANLPALPQSEWAWTLTSSTFPKWILECVQRFRARPDLSFFGTKSPGYYLSLSSPWHEGLILFSPWLLTHSFPNWRGLKQDGVEGENCRIWISLTTMPTTYASSLLNHRPTSSFFGLLAPLTFGGHFAYMAFSQNRYLDYAANVFDSQDVKSSC